MSIMPAHKNETLDAIVFRAYGDAPQMLAPLIAANPNILHLGIHLPEGTPINLPPTERTSKTVQTVNLWD